MSEANFLEISVGYVLCLNNRSYKKELFEMDLVDIKISDDNEDITLLKESDKIEGIVEGLLFAYGDPLHMEKIMKLLNLSKDDLLVIIDKMNTKYERASRGIMIRQINDCYQLYSKPQYFQYIKELMQPCDKISLSQAAYETLAIIACNKPITKAAVEQIRGVNCDSLVTKLLEYNLIKESGRMESPGRPILYEATDKFLRSFGFSSYNEVAATLQTISTENTCDV